MSESIEEQSEESELNSEKQFAESISNLEVERYRISIGFYKALATSVLIGALGIIVPGAIEFWGNHYKNKQKQAKTSKNNKK